MTPESDRLLLQFGPLLYVAWSDGALDRDELAQIKAQLAAVPGVSPAFVSFVRQWLDPDVPPTPSALHQLLHSMQQAARDRGLAAQPVRSSLSQLGQLLARVGERDEPGIDATPELRALRTLEEALGLEGTSDAINVVLGGAFAARTDEVAVPARPREVTSTPFQDRLLAGIDAPALHAFMAADRLAIQQRVNRILASPRLRLDPDAPHAEYRVRVLECCRELAAQGLGLLAYPIAHGGTGRIADSIAAFETIAYHDLSLLVKYGVQFGLFGGSVLQLGTQLHHERYLNAIGTLKLPGCFAMSETAHGSNVRDLETTARYDPATREFIIHTPHVAARKDYIGNAALHGRMATVFAQLEVGSERHGVHAFLVPLRDEAGRVLPGVTIEDCGPKAGLNGVDNGRISFRHVRVPRQNLLNRFADVSENGEYSSPIPGAARRFFTMLGTLVAGRISIACASVSVARLALTIATRYTAQRRQFGPEGGAEMPVLDYQSMQRALMPRIATAYALDAALYRLVRRYAALPEFNHQHRRTRADAESARTEIDPARQAPGTNADAVHWNTEHDAERRELEVLAASLKAYASWFGVQTVQAAREACGGIGYLRENRLGALREDADIFTTFEGANVVLEQLVAKGLLSEYREQFGELRIRTVFRYLTRRASTAVIEQNPIARRRTDREHLRDPDFHQAAFRFREERLLASVARRLKALLDGGRDSFTAMNACQDHLLALAHAHAERLILDGFRERMEECETPALRGLLRQMVALFALHALERDRAWFLESDYMEAGKTRAIRREVLALSSELATHALTLVDGFGIPDSLVRAPIAV